MAQREWKKIRDFEEILFEEYHGIAKITINRPRYRNAFTPKTTLELSQAFSYCREAQDICVVILTGAGSACSMCRCRYGGCPNLSSPW